MLARKVLLTIILFSAIGVFQYFVLDAIQVMSRDRIIQFMTMDMLMLVSLYGFRGFNLDVMRSPTALFVVSAFGSFFGGLFTTILALLLYGYNDALMKLDVIYSVVFGTVTFPVIIYLFYRSVQGFLIPFKCYVIGSEAVFGSIMDEVTAASHNKFKVMKWIEKKDDFTIHDENGNHKVILVADKKLYDEMKEEVNELMKRGYQKLFITNLTERWLLRIPLEIVEEFNEYYEVVFNHVEENTIKRIFDIIFAVVSIIIMVPIYLLTGLLVFINSGLPIIFKQERVGKFGQIFTMNKFRSMSNHAEKQGAKFATQQQSHITLIGKIMRPIRLDETPQFFDILLGDMSIVGPRPEQPSFVEELKRDVPYYAYRLAVKPGLSGWAQIQYQYASTLEEQRMKLSYDLYYIKNRNLILDITILIMTMEAVVFKRGAK